MKNNTSLEFQVNNYQCLHGVQGSDHRPIALSMTIKGFGQPHYHELTSDGAVGLLDLQLVYVEGLNFVDIA